MRAAGEILAAREAPRIVDGRYALVDKLGETQHSIVWAAEDQAQKKRVCIKFLRPEALRHDPEAVWRFKREASVMARLHHSNVVGVEGLGEVDGALYLVMELVEGRSLEDVIRQGPLAVPVVLSVLEQVALGLTEVHRQEIIHRDLKPANILLHGPLERATVRIIDFGYAGEVAPHALDEAGIVGTFQYMAPEQLGLFDRPVSPRVDLYATGCIAYEAITGAAAFQGATPSELIAQIQSRTPQPMSSLQQGVPPALEKIVAKLLSKNPDGRYQTADGLLADIRRLRQDFDHGRATPVFELDSASRTRLTGLGSVFVGRRMELARAEEVISELAQGKTHFLVVGGRSGSGKTAYVREACSRGLPYGLRFIRGKCYAMHTTLPYFAITEALNEACQLFKASPHRAEAIEQLTQALGPSVGVLVRLAPAWARLFPTAPIPKYEGEQKDREQVGLVVRCVLRQLARPDQPLAIFLDDLQWADSSTLELLNHFLSAVPDLPVLFVGTYRSEEVGTGHPLQRLLRAAPEGRMPLTALEMMPLSLEDVQDLLGKVLGKTPDEFVRYVHERSQGNAFFACELLRAISHAGVLQLMGDHVSVDMAAVESVDIPVNVLDVVLKRLGTLSDAGRRVLAVGALAGRSFTFQLLEEVMEVPPEQISSSLSQSTSAQLIQLVNESGQRSYAFAHDKILEACQDLVSESERADLHGRIGRYLESVAGETPSDDMVADLAYHFGRSDDRERALSYNLRAGDRAREQLSNERALEYYAAADQVLVSQAAPEADARRLDLMVKRAEVCDTLGRYEEAEAAYGRALSLTRDRVTMARYLAKVGYGQQKSGRYDESKKNLLHALRLLGVRLFLDGMGPRLGLPFERLRLMLTRFRLRLSVSSPGAVPDARRSLIIEILVRLWTFYGMTDSAKMYYLAFRLFWMAAPYGGSRELSNAHRIMAITLCQGRRPRFAGAIENAFSAIEVARRNAAKMEIATSYTYAGIVHSWQARPREALPYLDQGRTMLEAIGNIWDLVNSHIFLFRAKKALGQLDEAMSHAQTILKIAERTGGKGSLSSGYQKLGELLALKGDRRNAFEYGQKALAIALENKLTLDTCFSHKLMGSLYLREDRFDSARDQFEKAIAASEAPGASVMRAYVYDGYVGWAESVVRSPAGPERKALLRKAKAYLDEAVERERHYLNFLGYALRVRARYHWMNKDFDRAAADLEAADERIQIEAFPLDQAALFLDRADFVLAQGKPFAEMEDLLGHARSLFAKVEATGELARVDSIMKRLRPASGAEVAGASAERNAAQIKTLLEVSQLISSISSPREVMEKIVEASVKLMGAERGFLLVQEAGQEYGIRVARDVMGAALEVRVEDISLSIVRQVASEKKGVCLTDAMTDERFAQKESVIASNLRSVLCAPLVHQDRLYGVLYLDNRLVRQLFDSRDLEIVSSFAAQAAIALANNQAYAQLQDLNENLEAKVGERTVELVKSNAALAQSLKDLTDTQLRLLAAENEAMQKEMLMARSIQDRILPPRKLFHRPGISFLGEVEPATQVGGDFWSCLELPDDKTLLMVGDVTGHGVASGMVTTVAKACCDTLLRTGHTDLQLIVAALSDVLYEAAKGALQMTALICVVDPAKRVLSYVNAAHVPPFVLEPQEPEPKLSTLSRPGRLLGAAPGIEFTISDYPYQPNTRLFIYTDGLVECTNAAEVAYGNRRLRQGVLKGARLGLTEQLEAILRDARAFFGEHPHQDDITLLGLQLR